jgi:leucyl aminopeptidase
LRKGIIELKQPIIHSSATTAALKTSDVVVIFSKIPEKTRDTKPQLPNWISSHSKATKNKLEQRWSFLKTPPKTSDTVYFDQNAQQGVLVVICEPKCEMFEKLSLAKKAIKDLAHLKYQSIAIDLSELEHCEAWAHSFAAAIMATKASFEKFLKKPSNASKSSKVEIHFVGNKESLAAIKASAINGIKLTSFTNQTRVLAKRPANDLNPKTMIDEVIEESKKLGVKTKKYSVSELKKIGAGAFLSVCQGSTAQDAAIVKLQRQPKTKSQVKRPRITLVGKGVTYDTGGINLKPARYMFGMHGDMTGAAVAFSLFKYIVSQNWDCELSAYLAIAENAIGPEAYHPNQVVKALNGKTIEIVHTDAEGRMLLSDTLTLASREKPDFILDFATLTGSCVGAISNRYCGVFSNRRDSFENILKAGRDSGERAWPFPMDADFAVPLKSDVADIKQCRLTGGVDHIEAALFLKEFIENDPDWFHVDLSSSECEGGLAHVDDEVTGFGVRFGAQLIANQFAFELN